jgi:hypothetical protein
VSAKLLMNFFGYLHNFVLELFERLNLVSHKVVGDPHFSIELRIAINAGKEKDEN